MSKVEKTTQNAAAQVLLTEYAYLNKTYAPSSRGDFKPWVFSVHDSHLDELK